MAPYQKLHHSIGEVAEMFGVNASLIRFWEKEFSSIQPKKNEKGNRLYTIDDIKCIERVYDLVKVQGYTLDGAKLQLKSEQMGDKQLDAVRHSVVERLERVRKELIQLQSLVS